MDKVHDVTVPCKKCGNKVPSYSLKLDLDEKMVICPECIKNKKLHTEIQEEVFHKHALKAPVMNKPVTEQTLHKIAHKCTSCGYKFKIDSETGQPKNCPYCNARVMGF